MAEEKKDDEEKPEVVESAPESEEPTSTEAAKIPTGEDGLPDFFGTGGGGEDIIDLVGSTSGAVVTGDGASGAVVTGEGSGGTATMVCEITEKLTGLGLGADKIEKIKALGAETVADLSSLTESDLTGMEIPVLKARRIVKDLNGASERADAVTATAATAATNATAALDFGSLLPNVPDDSSWLDSLRTGGVLNPQIGHSIVVTAVKAALADSVGLYDVPETIVAAMEAHIEVTEELASKEFFALRKQLKRRSYGDLFEAIDGLDGSFITNARRNELLSRIRETLWPAIKTFNDALTGWQETWMAGAGNPAGMMAMILGGAGGGGMMPPGMMQPPDCGILRDAAESVNDKLNKLFRGTGVQVASALAFEANTIQKVLQNPRIPTLCGVTTRDLLLKKLKLDVPATYKRLELNLTRFLMAIMSTNDIPGGEEELRYFGTLFALGRQIPWGDLPTGGKVRRTKGTKKLRDIEKDVNARLHGRRLKGIGEDYDEEVDD